jgi:capsular polysaccharide biosynthesis protein
VVTIGQFFGTLRRRLGLLLLMMVLGVLAAGALLVNTPKTYEATAVVDISATSGAAASSVSTITESRIVTSTSVVLAAQRTLGYAGTPTELARQVTVTSPLDSQVLYITFNAGSGRDAANGANAFANAYLDYRTQIAQKDITLRISRIQSQVADLQKDLAALKVGANDSQRILLQNQIQQLQGQLNTYQTSVITPGQLAGEAAAPSSPSSPRRVLYLAGGLLIGLLAGIILAVLRDRRDDRVRNSAELEHSLGAPVIVESTVSEGGSRPGPPAAVAAPRSAEADAYRTLATAVASHSAGSRTVVLCGTGQDGVSLAPLNLAATFAMQGLQTVIIVPDPAIEPASELLGVQGIPATSDAGLAGLLAPSDQLPALRVLSLGDEVSLGAALRANDDSLDEIRNTVDIMVLDGVNVELPSTAIRLGQIADQVVVVAYRNRSTHSEIERLARQLAQVGVTVVGGVLLSRRTGLHSRLHRHKDKGRRRSARGAGHREVARSQPAAEPRSQSYPVQAPDLAQPDLAQPDLAQPDLAQPNLVQPDLAQPAGVVSEPADRWGSGAVATSDTPAEVLDAPSAYSARYGGSTSTPPGAPRPAPARKG